MTNLLDAVLFFGSCVLSAYVGIFVYFNWPRVVLAAAILRGRIVYDEKKENGKFGCARQHPEPGHVVVKGDEYKELQRAASELVFARGFIAEIEALRGKTTYADAYLEVSGK